MTNWFPPADASPRLPSRQGSGFPSLSFAVRRALQVTLDAATDPDRAAQRGLSAVWGRLRRVLPPHGLGNGRTS